MNITLIKTIKIAAIYIILSVLWILFSDNLILSITFEPKVLTFMQSIKGFFYIAVVSVVLFVIIYKEFRRTMNSELKAKENSELMESILTTITYGIIVVEKESETISYSNNEIIKITGYSDKELFDFIKNNIYDDISDGSEISINDKNNKKKILSIVKNDINEKSEVYIIGDISSIIETRDKLRKSEENYRLVLSTVQEGIVIINHKTGNLIYANNKYFSMLGYEIKKDYTELSIYDFIDKDDIKKAKNYIELCNFSAKWKNEIKFVRKDGMPLWAMVSASIMGNKENSSEVILIINDMTERKSYEESITSAKEEAEKANMSKSVFMANMSYEMRTPLNGILGIEYLLAKSDLDSTQKEYLEMLQISTDELLDMVNDILDMSRLEAGAVKTEEMDFYMSELIEDINKVVVAKLDKKGIRLKIESNLKSDYFINGDVKIIQQVFYILINNSTKQVDRGEITLKINEESKNHNRINFKFEIMNSYFNIEKEHYESIFDIYTHYGAEYKGKKYGGAGIGFTVAKKLLEKIKGSVSIKSIDGGGTSFSFIVPFILKEEKEKEVIIPQSGMIKNYENTSILVVEDNEVNITLIKHLLQRKGYMVDIAMNGTDAIKKAMENDYDTILMDLQLPEMNGYEVTAEIRKNKDKIGIPIIAVTAYAYDKDKCIESGMDDYISKPFKPNELYDIIEKHRSKESPVIHKTEDIRS